MDNQDSSAGIKKHKFCRSFSFTDSLLLIKTLMDETMFEVTGENEFEEQDNSILSAYFEHLDSQDFDALINMNDFKNNFSSISVKLRISTSKEEIYAVVLKKNKKVNTEEI